MLPPNKESASQFIKEVRRHARRKYTAEHKILIILGKQLVLPECKVAGNFTTYPTMWKNL